MQTLNSMKKFIWPKRIGTSSVLAQANISGISLAPSISGKFPNTEMPRDSTLESPPASRPRDLCRFQSNPNERPIETGSRFVADPESTIPLSWTTSSSPEAISDKRGIKLPGSAARPEYAIRDIIRLLAKSSLFVPQAFLAVSAPLHNYSEGQLPPERFPSTRDP